MDKEYVVHMYSGIVLNHKKNEIMPLGATWMDVVIAILSEESQKEKDKCPLHVEPKKIVQVNLLTKWKQTLKTYDYQKGKAEVGKR